MEREVFALSDAEQEERGLLLASVEVRPHRGRPGPGEPMGCDLYVRSEQVANPESAVSLGASQRDYFGLRPVVLNWRLQPIDWVSVVRTAELVAAELERRYDTRAELLITDDTRWPWIPASPTSPGNATWGNHHMGTTRMADSLQDGVVDRDCRVHGIENLYVAGSSVFPTGSCANPTFMILTLTKRLGAHLTGASKHLAVSAKADPGELV
jgi:choline dehydrogenase-like flavoprotein